MPAGDRRRRHHPAEMRDLCCRRRHRFLARPSADATAAMDRAQRSGREALQRQGCPAHRRKCACKSRSKLWGGPCAEGTRPVAARKLRLFYQPEQFRRGDAPRARVMRPQRRRAMCHRCHGRRACGCHPDHDEGRPDFSGRRTHRRSQPISATASRDDLRMLADGWSAVAVGAAGHADVSVKAGKEEEATTAALADCAGHDKNCRVIAIGMFAVEPN